MEDSKLDEAVAEVAERVETLESEGGVWVEPDWESEDAAEAAPEHEPETGLGFDLEKFRYSGPWPERIPDASECTVYNGGAATVKELLSGNTQPVLAIDGEVWDEVQHLVHKTPSSELACFLILKQFASGVPKYLAVDLFFPKQEVGGTGVAIDGPSANKFYEDLSRHEDYSEHMHSRLCHLHSHGGMDCFWSAADTNQQMSRDDLGFYDDFRFYVVVNTKNELRCSFVQYKPFLRRFDNLPVVVIGRPKPISDEREAELDSWLAERTSRLVTNVFSNIRTFPAYATEEYPQTRWYGYGGGYYGGGSYGRYEQKRIGYAGKYDGFGGKTYEPEPRREPAREPKPAPDRLAETSLVAGFVDYLIGMTPYALGDEFSATELEELDRLVEDDGGDAANLLAKELASMTYPDKGDMWSSFMEFADGWDTSDLPGIVEAMLSWVNWLTENESEVMMLSDFFKTI